MSAKILDGKTLAKKILSELAKEIEQIRLIKGRSPGLAVLMVGDNPASAVYVNNKERSCLGVGMNSYGNHFPGDIDQSIVIEEIEKLNQDPKVDGILLWNS